VCGDCRRETQASKQTGYGKIELFDALAHVRGQVAARMGGRPAASLLVASWVFILVSALIGKRLYAQPAIEKSGARRTTSARFLCNYGYAERLMLYYLDSPGNFQLKRVRQIQLDAAGWTEKNLEDLLAANIDSLIRTDQLFIMPRSGGGKRTRHHGVGQVWHAVLV